MDDSYKHPENERRVKFRSNVMGTKEENLKWVIWVTIITFILSSGLSAISSIILEDSNIFISLLIVLVIVLLGIVSDTIGIAVTAADEPPFHSMASRKLYGAKQAIKLIRNANKVSSICNDVVGDICGVISGAASGFIVVSITVAYGGLMETFASIAITGAVASLTIGGKAIGKTLAIERSNYIVYKVAVILKFLIGRISFIKHDSKAKKRK